MGYENEATHKNYRMMEVTGAGHEVCHPNCGDSCRFPLRHCSGTSSWWRRFWIFKDCGNCTRSGGSWWCRFPEWALVGLFGLLALLGTCMCFLCICCCRGNGTRDVHTVENFRTKDTYIDEEVVQPIHEEVIEEEVYVEESPRVYQSVVEE